MERVNLSLEIRPINEDAPVEERPNRFVVIITWHASHTRFVQNRQDCIEGKSRYEARTWQAAYRAACRVIDCIGDDKIRAALHRGVSVVPLAHLIISAIHVERPRGYRDVVAHAYAEYTWRFIGTTPGTWDVQVDERSAQRMLGIRDYRFDDHR